MQDFTCWANGSLVPKEQATVSILDHGLLYGDGAFEGLRFYNGKPFSLDKHLTRLKKSLHTLCIALPFSVEELEQGVRDCIEVSPLNDGYLRIIVTRGVGSLGLNPQHCQQANVFIIAAALELVPEEIQNKGLSVITASTRRPAGVGLDARVKSLNYLNSILAKMEANHAGVDEALLLNQQGYVAECSAENLFIVDNGVLKTPPVTDGALAGITRELVLCVAKDLDFPTVETSLLPYDIYQAEECFLTGSGARLLKVNDLDGRIIGQNNQEHEDFKMFVQIQAAMVERIQQACS